MIYCLKFNYNLLALCRLFTPTKACHTLNHLCIMSFLIRKERLYLLLFLSYHVKHYTRLSDVPCFPTCTHTLLYYIKSSPQSQGLLIRNTHFAAQFPMQETKKKQVFLLLSFCRLGRQVLITILQYIVLMIITSYK